MYILGKRVEDVNESDIKRLVENSVQENKSLDYKRAFALNQDKEKKEFLYDIASMSNTDGGCFVYGIEESKDEKGQGTGKPDSIVGITVDNYDKLSQQIEDLIRGNTEPGIANIGLKLIAVDGKQVLIIGVSKNLGLPTMVTFNETNKFYRRKNTGKYPVDVYELNQMFMQNQVLRESAEKFRKDRIEKVRSSKVFPNIQTETSFFIHIIPYGFQSEQLLDLTNPEQFKLWETMRPMYKSGWTPMHNTDGYAAYNTANAKISSYDQLIRNGVYEVYTSEMFDTTNVNGKTILMMYGIDFIPDVLEKIRNGIAVLKKLKIEPPFIIGISMHGISGAVISANSRWGNPFLVDEIILPQIIVPTFETDLYKQLKPAFDIIWQAVSERQSPPYHGK